jgi:hypothetical protein
LCPDWTAFGVSSCEKRRPEKIKANEKNKKLLFMSFVSFKNLKIIFFSIN